MNTQVSLRTTLLLLCLGVPFQNDRLDISILLWYLLWNHNSNTKNTLTLELSFFYKETLLSELEAIIDQQQQSISDLSFSTTLAAVLDPFTQRLSG